MGTILGFFVFGAIGWYIVMLLFAIWTFFIIEKNDLTLGIIELILCLIFVQFMGKTNILGYIFNNPVLVLLEIVSYFAIGFIWSFIKWWLYVKEKAEEFKQIKDKFFNDHGRQSPGVQDDWERSKPFGLKKPIAMEHRGGIAIWVIYWPLSLIWSLINDFIKKIIRQIITYLKKWYQGIADKAFKGLDD